MLNIQHNGIHVFPDIAHNCCPNFDVRGQFGCQNIKVHTPILSRPDTPDSLQELLCITISPRLKLAVYNIQKITELQYEQC